MEHGLNQTTLTSPKIPFTGQQAIPYIFGYVLGLEGGFGIIPVILLKDVLDNLCIPGKNDFITRAYLHLKGIPEFFKIFVVEREGVGKSPLAISENRER